MGLTLAGGGYAPGLQTVEVLESLKNANKVYVDTYTMPGARWLLDLARSYARGSVVAAERKVLEEGSSSIAREALDSNVVVLVPGDPLIATTHAALLAEAARAGATIRLLPGVSGVCAAKSLSLLHYYRFGRTITVPGPWRGVKAYSVVEAIYGNICVGLHTMLLLDVEEGGAGQLGPGEAVSILLSHEAELSMEAGYEPFLGRLPLLVVSAGPNGSHFISIHEKMIAAEKLEHPEGRIYSLVVPAELHESEEWALREVYGFKGYDKTIYRLAERVCGLLRFSARGVSIQV